LITAWLATSTIETSSLRAFALKHLLVGAEADSTGTSAHRDIVFYLPGRRINDRYDVRLAERNEKVDPITDFGGDIQGFFISAHRDAFGPGAGRNLFLDEFLRHADHLNRGFCLVDT
jgi:hypothetical protein